MRYLGSSLDRIGARPRIAAALVALLGPVACGGGEELVPVTPVIETGLAGFGVESVVPETVSVGEEFSIQFETYGDSCTRPGDMDDVAVREPEETLGVLRVMPWDFRITSFANPFAVNCADILRTFSRTVKVRAGPGRDGKLRIVLVGVSTASGEERTIEVERSLVVRP